MRRPSHLLLLALMPACIETGISNKDDVTGGNDSDPPVVDSEDSDEPPPEECDGVDNDADGAVDEGYDDVDADGVADCEDNDCEIPLADPVSEVDEDCQGSTSGSTPPANPWSWVIDWEWRQGAVYSTPAVADLDQDGVPEVVFTSARGSGELHVLDGRNGAEIWSRSGYDYQSGVAIADVDGDGLGDIIASTGSCYSAHTLVALDYAGNTLWSTATGSACESYPYVADLEGDGVPEVVFNQFILNATTGAILSTLGVSGDPWGAPAVADLDLDGVQEVMVAGGVFRADGTHMFNCGNGGVGSFPHPVNADADAEGEVLVAGNGAMTLCDTNGSVIWTNSYSSYGAPLAIADFDNDGEQEFAFAKQNSLRLIERNNSTLWTAPITDNSGLAGSTSWDIDLDGVPEVVYADEQDILVLNGATGAVVIREGSHSSATLAETPAAADVSGDGHGQLIYGSNGSLNGLTVIGSADGDWPYSPPVYNQYGYFGHNINADLSVPATLDPPWLHAANLYRGQPSAVFAVRGLPDLQVAITDVCAASCDDNGLVRIAVQLWNSGGSPVPAGTTVDLYGYPAGTPFLLYSYALEADLEPATSYEREFGTTVAQAGELLRLVADDANLVEECDEGNNEHTLPTLPCN